MRSYLNNQGSKEVKKPKKVNVVVGFIAVSFLAVLVHWDVSLPSWVLMGGAMIGFLVLLIKSLKSPIPAFIALICYMPFSKILVGDFGGVFRALNFTNVLMIFIIIGMFAQLAGTRKPLFGKNSLNILIGLFCTAIIFSFVRGVFYFGYYVDFVELLSQAKRWVTPCLIFYLAFNALNNEESVKKVVKIIMVVVFIVGVMACVDYMNVGNVSSLEKSRIGGISDQPNQLAGFFVYYMFLYVGFFLTKFPSFGAWGYLVPMLVTFRGIMVTFSRGGYLAFAFASLAVVFFKNKILFILVAACLVFVILNPVFLPEGIKYRLGQTVEQDIYSDDSMLEDSLEASSANRIRIWKTGLAMIIDNPIFGYGHGTFPSVATSYNPQLGAMDAHNSYITIAAEMGVPALLIFLLIIAVFFKETRWVYKNTSDPFFKATALGVLGTIFGLLVINMFGSRLNTLEISGYFWVLAGVILRMKAIEIENKKLSKR